MTTHDQPQHPRVGIGVIIRREGKVLLGLRRGAHGAGTWALPGGHLEFGESFEACAAREAAEETGLRIAIEGIGPCTNDVMPAEHRHYVTVFVLSASASASGTPEVREPDKCERWAWFDWAALPEPLFLPLRHLVASGFVPGEA